MIKVITGKRTGNKLNESDEDKKGLVKLMRMIEKKNDDDDDKFGT